MDFLLQTRQKKIEEEKEIFTIWSVPTSIKFFQTFIWVSVFRAPSAAFLVRAGDVVVQLIEMYSLEQAACGCQVGWFPAENIRACFSVSSS